ncbi:hypothetical protein BOTBODRAFT_163453 [Botryobasidium botryosum FD-172 SS1]|uniref:Major facilitator superfamily (MFS) profile domain-containing protein n=1 Tax=Botryobasidium botryosum (strain FD-172 SS1) TaxID=930990 RepID=A0A067MFT3_BOTB1|nr:hypothetical protein BOTBODRAFT_163453 [Botryobasidium botryosum FD-172 SS1]
MASQGMFKNIHIYFLAIVAYWGILLFGYDTGVAGGVITQKAFKDNFGLANATKAHADAVGSNVVAVLQGGAFFGALGSAPISSAIGRKWTLEIFALVFCLGAILQTVAGDGRGLGYIYGGRVVAGVGIGAISAVAPAYVSESAPRDVRGRITGLFQIFVATGVMLSYFVNYGVAQHIPEGPMVWRVPFGLQLVPGGIMALGLIFTKESPRWLAQKGRNEEALANLAFLRRAHRDDPDVRAELAEIEAAIVEEKEARVGLGLKEAFFGKGNFIRFVIAFAMFTFQQFSGQNSVGYYAPQIFQSIGYTGTSASLLASGVYGIVKVAATAIFVFFGIETIGRRYALFTSSLWMGTLFFIIGALLKTHPPDPTSDIVQPASKAMAALLYIYVVGYSFGWGPVPWIYVSDIFPTRTRHYGLSLASGTQWLFNFVISKITPTMQTNLGYKIFMTFATINILGMAVFSFFLPETKGRSLEEMDVIFGSVTQEHRDADLRKTQKAMDNDLGTSHIGTGVVRSDSDSSGEKARVQEAEIAQKV